ncbi:MAG: hypothetical protein ACREOG_23495 [Gemmatimonadaceae bacterium]
MKLKSASTAAVIALLAATMACGAERTPTTSAVQAEGEAFLAVTNDHFLDAVVYVIRAGSRQRIGTITGLSTDTIPLRGVLTGAGTVRLLVEPIGLTQRHVTEPIQVLPNEMVELTIRSPLNLTSVTVWRR